MECLLKLQCTSPSFQEPPLQIRQVFLNTMWHVQSCPKTRTSRTFRTFKIIQNTRSHTNIMNIMKIMNPGIPRSWPKLLATKPNPHRGAATCWRTLWPSASVATFTIFTYLHVLRIVMIDEYGNGWQWHERLQDLTSKITCLHKYLDVSWGLLPSKTWKTGLHFTHLECGCWDFDSLGSLGTFSPRIPRSAGLIILQVPFACFCALYT